MATTAAMNRGQVLYRVAELMEGRFDQFVPEAAVGEGITPAAARVTVARAIDRWVWYAGWTDKIAQILGSYGQLLSNSEDNIEDGVFAHNLMGAFQSGINHSSAQVMRDQVARRGLGMPRG